MVHVLLYPLLWIVTGDMDSVYVCVLTALTATIISIAWICMKHRRKFKKKKLDYTDVLKLIQQEKLFPLGPAHDWTLEALRFEHRVWRRNVPLGAAGSHNTLDLYGTFSKVKGSSQQTVLSFLVNTDKFPEWRLSLTNVKQVISPHVITIANVTSGSAAWKNYTDPTGAQHDVIEGDAAYLDNAPRRWCNALRLWLTRKPVGSLRCQITRCWNKEENGCCWMLEMMVSDPTLWTFYLAQPLDKLFELDNCLLSVVCSTNSKQTSENTKMPTNILTAFQNYLQLRKVQGVPLTSITYDLQSTKDDEPENAESSEAPVTTTSKAKTMLDDVLSKFEISKEEGKSEPMFIKRFKNLIEEKKEWYEEKKRKAANKVTEKTKAKEEEIDSILSDRQIQMDQSASEKEDGNQNEYTDKSKRSDSKSKLIRSKTIDYSKESVVDSDEDQVPATFGQRMRQRWWSDKQSKSLDTTSQGEEFTSVNADDSENDDGIHIEIKKDIDKLNQGTDNTLEEAYMEAGREASAEILAMKSKISNIDIQVSYDQQSKKSGGWIYCGLEREVVVLRKIYQEGTPMQSYLGKGMISCPPKTVFEALKNPRTRFTYDDMLKKLDTLHEFPNGMKILYWYHEVSQLFKKESRDFCILQYEHVEGGKYVISLRSVGWPGCMERDDITRATLHASGWIIEPVPKDNRLNSMVTYIVQMELGHSKSNTGYLMEEMAAKQPLGIAFLRQYLVPTSSIPRPLTQIRRRSTPIDLDNDSTSSRHDNTIVNTLAVLAAQYGTPTERPDDQDYKTIAC